MIDPALVTQVRDLLARMSVLSEVGATPIGRNVTSSKSEDRPPRGPNQSTFDRWHQHFNDYWDNQDRVAVLLRLARLELEGILHGVPARPRTDTGAVDEPTDQERIITWYRGLAPEVAAEMESLMGSRCDAMHIRRVRTRNECDPREGNPRPELSKRQRVARELSARGYSERKIAVELNISRATVRRYLHVDEPTAQKKAA